MVGEAVSHHMNKLAAVTAAAALIGGVLADRVFGPVDALAHPIDGSGDLVASAASADCPPGHIKLSVLGPQNVTPGASEHYTLVAKDCPTPAPTMLKGVTLTESGPNHQKLRWPIPRFRSGQTKREGFDVTVPATASSTSAAGGEAITVRALANGGRQLGKGSLPLHMLTAQPPVGHEQPGIYLSSNILQGPLTDVKLDQKYTYTFDVVPEHSYMNAGVALTAQASSCRTVAQNINLVAGRPSRVSFWVDFITDRDASSGIFIDELSPKSATGSQVLDEKNFPLTFTPGQVPQPHGTGNGGNEFCGVE